MRGEVIAERAIGIARKGGTVEPGQKLLGFTVLFVKQIRIACAHGTVCLGERRAVVYQRAVQIEDDCFFGVVHVRDSLESFRRSVNSRMAR